MGTHNEPRWDAVAGAQADVFSVLATVDAALACLAAAAGAMADGGSGDDHLGAAAAYVDDAVRACERAALRIGAARKR